MAALTIFRVEECYSLILDSAPKGPLIGLAIAILDEEEWVEGGTWNLEERDVARRSALDKCETVDFSCAKCLHKMTAIPGLKLID